MKNNWQPRYAKGQDSLIHFTNTISMVMLKFGLFFYSNNKKEVIMGYYFRGIISNHEISNLIKTKLRNVCIIHLYNNLVTIPLTDELYDEINENQGVSFSHYEYLTDRVGLLCSDLSTICTIAYIEAEYFGGIGLQNGIVWNNEQVIYEETTSENAINKSLVYLGIKKLEGRDEFDTVGLGRHRFIDDWIRKEAHL